MVAINRTPQNINLLQASKFLLVFDRIPNTHFFCQSANVPGLSIGQATISTPLIDFYAPGNKITYNPFNITFLVNGDVQSWKDLHDWFRSIASPESFDERNRLANLQSNRNNLKSYSDATLTIVNNLNNPIIRVHFTNMFPTSLSDIQFDTKLSADDIITADVTFVYEQFEFMPI